MMGCESLLTTGEVGGIILIATILTLCFCLGVIVWRNM